MTEFLTPTITIATWIVCAILKLWINDKDRKIIPTVAAILGLGLGLGTVGLDLHGAIVGAVSGLAATGANELFKQYKKDTEVTPDE